jgi:hypothetical protein
MPESASIPLKTNTNRRSLAPVSGAAVLLWPRVRTTAAHAAVPPATYKTQQMQQNATRPSKLRECSSANCGYVHPPAFDPDEPKTRLRNEPNLTLYFQQELRTKAKFHPQRQADSPAHGCIRVQPDATRSQIVRMLHPLRGGRTPAVEPKIRLRNEANSSFLFNKGSKWKPNSVSARLRRPPPTRHKCNLMQHSQQNRYNPAVATRFTPITVRNGFSPSSPAVPIRLARNGADTMKLKDLREIGFVRRKNAEPQCPTAQALDSRQSLQIAERHPFSSPCVACTVTRFARSGVTQPKHRPARQLLSFQ